MNWEQLLSLKDKATQASDYVLNKMILVWVLKYDRIIFRRLLESQDKTGDSTF
jgi:hypothetical protein